MIRQNSLEQEAPRLTSPLATSVLTRPNFFILGAPKCGTTSLAEWLGEHSDVFVCNPKEPKFFNTDWKLPNRPDTLAAYERLFDQAKGCAFVGEATTGYLCSDVAVSKILEYSPSAKFVVCLREPIEMLASLHAQRLKEGVETEICLLTAWQKQSLRRRGQQVPISCTEAKTLLYGDICSLGAQVERLLHTVDRSRVCFVLLEDIKQDPQQEYRRVLTFLGAEDDRRTDFPVRNKGSVPRSLWLSQISRVVGRLKKQIGIRQNFGLQQRLRARNEVPKSVAIDLAFRSELVAYFCEDIQKLGRLIDRDLGRWLAER